MFIKRLEKTTSLAKVESEFKDILSISTWGEKNQIGLKCRPNAENKWFDACGSLYDKIRLAKVSKESDFTEWNLDRNSYIRQQIELLERNHNFTCGRVRIMRLMPHAGLSVHRDDEVRYHLVLRTNPKAYIAHNVVDNNPERSVLPTTSVCYHIPMDGCWYKVDTREIHWVYNGGEENRIHLVVCGQA